MLNRPANRVVLSSSISSQKRNNRRVASSSDIFSRTPLSCTAAVAPIGTSALRERAGFMHRACAPASLGLLSWWCLPMGLSTKGRRLCSGRASRARHVLRRPCIPLSCGQAHWAPLYGLLASLCHWLGFIGGSSCVSYSFAAYSRHEFLKLGRF
jgi:hypothetical protein